MLVKKKFLQTLGLCKRANALLSGDELFKSLSSGNVYLVVLGSDASDRMPCVVRPRYGSGTQVTQVNLSHFLVTYSQMRARAWRAH